MGVERAGANKIVYRAPSVGLDLYGPRSLKVQFLLSCKNCRCARNDGSIRASLIAGLQLYGYLMAQDLVLFGEAFYLAEIFSQVTGNLFAIFIDAGVYLDLPVRGYSYLYLPVHRFLLTGRLKLPICEGVFGASSLRRTTKYASLLAPRLLSSGLFEQPEPNRCFQHPSNPLRESVSRPLSPARWLSRSQRASCPLWTRRHISASICSKKSSRPCCRRRAGSFRSSLLSHL